MTPLPANDAKVVFCPPKTEGRMSWLPVNLKNSLWALAFALCFEPRAFALELANTAERPEALKDPVTRSIVGLPSLEHSAGRNLVTFSFANLDLL